MRRHSRVSPRIQILISAIACYSLERAINEALKLDESSPQRLRKLDGKSVAIDITDWQMSACITFYDHGVQVSAKPVEHCSTRIKGTLFGLFRVGLAKGDSKALFAEKIDIDGDTQVAELTRNLFTELNLDWEGRLANIVGGQAAHQVGRGARHIIKAFKQARLATAESTTEYLQYEINCLPNGDEVQDFISAVGQCRNDVDRLAARVALLKDRIS